MKNKVKDFTDTELRIINYISEKRQCMYGDVIKNLKLSYIKGQQSIGSLVSRGFLRFVGTTSCLELDRNIQNLG